MKLFSRIFVVLLLSSFGLTANATPKNNTNHSLKMWNINERHIAYKDLPVEIKDFISTHFSAYKFLEAEKNLWPSKNGKLYEVDLTKGIDLEFDKKGDWLEIETPRSVGVPEALIPQEIKAYVNENYADQKITSIAKKRYGYEIELANDLDIKFDKQGGFLSIDY